MGIANDKLQAFEVKRLTKPLAIETLSLSEGTFSGEGMVFGEEHPTSSWRLGPEWKDRVEPGAFTETLAAHAAAGTKPMMLFMHERGNIPGVWTKITETKKSLKVEGKVSPKAITPSGVPLLELMKMEAIDGVSIGFVPTRVMLDEKAKVRSIQAVDLGEISIVDIPGANKARITDVKSGDVRALEAGLRTLGLSKREAKALISGGFAALFGEGDSPEARALAQQLEDFKAHGETPESGDNGRDASGNIVQSISDFARSLRSA